MKSFNLIGIATIRWLVNNWLIASRLDSADLWGSLSVYSAERGLRIRCVVLLSKGDWKGQSTIYFDTVIQNFSSNVLLHFVHTHMHQLLSFASGLVPACIVSCESPVYAMHNSGIQFIALNIFLILFYVTLQTFAILLYTCAKMYYYSFWFCKFTEPYFTHWCFLYYMAVTLSEH